MHLSGLCTLYSYFIRDCVFIYIRRRVAGSINMEFRGIDKFVSELGSTVLVVTDSWIIKSNVHTVNIIHQRDAVLKLVAIDCCNHH